jgi:hypothetical protein
MRQINQVALGCDAARRRIFFGEVREPRKAPEKQRGQSSQKI